MTNQSNNKNPNVLCVEDNRINQMILVKALDGLNITITLANNGKQVLDLLSGTLLKNTEDTRFDLIIMDCQMPEMDGFEATKLIRNNEKYASYKRLPIIAMTGNDSVENREHCIAVGMNDFLSKPIERELLHQRVIYWLMHKVDSEANEASNISTNESINAPKNNAKQSLQDATWDKNSFLARVKYNQILAEQIIVLFLNEMPSVCESLLRAITEQNMEQVHALAHKLKGTVNNVSGFKLGLLLKDIERLAKGNNTEALNELTDSLSHEFMLLIRHLNAYI